jgi:threonine dehydrogenase-like Zn-dependent dehydrogenase
MGTDRPHVLRQAIHCCRNFGTVSIVGVYGGLLDKIPMGSAINRGLTFPDGTDSRATLSAAAPRPH